MKYGHSKKFNKVKLQKFGTNVALIMEQKTYQVKLIWNVSIRRGSNFTFTQACVTRSKREWEV